MSNDTGTADVLAILTRIVARLEAIEKHLEIGKEPPAPQPEPQAPIDGFDWKTVFGSDAPESVPPRMTDYDRDEICRRAWHGYLWNGSSAPIGNTELDRPRRVVRAVVEDPTIVSYGKRVAVSPKLIHAVHEYWTVLLGISTRKPLSIAADADMETVEQLERAATAYLVSIIVANNIEPDAAFVLLLTGEIHPLRPEPTFGVSGPGVVAQFKDMTMESLWDRDHQDVGGGTPSGRL